MSTEMKYARPVYTFVSMEENRFEYINDEHTMLMMINGFQAISRLELWEFMQKDPGQGGYMFSAHPEIYSIMSMMENCEYPPGHSGASFGCIMRELQYIARYGQEEYKKRVLLGQQEK